MENIKKINKKASRSAIWFVYYLLARSEERECFEKYGESYRDYYQKTGRFLPRIKKNITDHLGEILPPKGVKRIGALMVVYLLTVACTIVLGLFARSYSLSRISTIVRDNAAVISTVPMGKSQMAKIVSIAVNEANGRHRLVQIADPVDTRQLIYIVPLEWRIPELTMESAQNGQRGHGFNPTNHMNPTDFDRNLYKVLFSMTGVDEGVAGKDIISKARYQKPFLLVKLNLQTKRVIGIETPPHQGKYAGVPVPIF
jgi:hypothetical protein